MNKATRMLENTFRLRMADLDTIISDGLCDGGDWCDLYFEFSSFFSLTLRDSAVTSGGRHEDYGCGIRVLSGEKTGYAYAETTELKALRNAARAAASIASGNAATTATAAFDAAGVTGTAHELGTSGAGLYPFTQDWRDTESAAVIPWLNRLEAEIRRREPRTDKVIAAFNSDVSEVLMYNSLRELCCDLRPMGSIAVTVIFTSDGRSINNSASRSFRAGAEMLSEALISELAAEAVEGVDEAFAARRPKGGKMSVVMGAGASGILLHEAMGHAFEADFIRKNQSVFSGKIGKRICRRGITIVDDGTIPGNRGACNFDDEGVPAQKTAMVTDGVLTSFLHDRISAKFFHLPPTGNGRRESFRYNPIPRMRATYMENGSDGTLEDLISSVKKGVYVNRFSNGQVKIGEGDF
ncbi:MAG: TldD/PmbA family protein, partial [Bacteroidales bacterium]|nr:TldD/PmbA family protein [Bacteroidales bacterium]